MFKKTKLRPTALIQCAYKMAEKYHQHDKRIISGDPYLVHPVAVAKRLQQLRFSEIYVAAGLIHDCPEDHSETCLFTDLLDGFSAEGCDSDKAARAVELVGAVTYDQCYQTKYEQQLRYREALMHNPQAIPLALADAADNLSDIEISLHTFKINVFGRNYLNCDPCEELNNWLAIAGIGYDKGGNDPRIKMLCDEVAKHAEMIEKVLRM